MPPSGIIDEIKAAAGRHVSRETVGKIMRYVELLTGAATVQNLISSSTIDEVWNRHILDSAQLVRLEPRGGASWADVGSGAGLPGLVVAMLTEGPVTLIEPRRLRAEFLRKAVEDLDLASRVVVEQAKVERVAGQFGVITARAVAQLDQLFAITHHLSNSETVWVLPKGRNAQSELAHARRNWHCTALVEQSRTDPESEILVLTSVGAKKPR